MHRWRILVPGVPLYTDLGFLGLCNVSLIEADGEYVIFDTGHYGIREVLLRALGNEGLKLEDVGHVVLSHLHYDHSLNSLLFREARVYVLDKELNYVRQGGDYYTVNFLPDLLGDRLTIVRDGDELMGMRFIALPGHTGGTMGLLLNDGTLFAGDAVKYVSEAREGRVTFAYHSLDEANESLRRAMSIAKTIVPGHDLPFRINNGAVEVLGDRRTLELYLRGNVEIKVLTK